LNTGQDADSVSSDHSQAQALLEPLAPPGVTIEINKFLCEATQKRGRLSLHISGLNCNWLNVVIAFEVMAILAIFSLRPCSRNTCLSGSVFVVAQGKVSTSVAES